MKKVKMDIPKRSQEGIPLRLKISVWQRGWKDFVQAWETIPTLAAAVPSG